MVNILPGAPRQDPMERMLALFRVGMSVRQQKLQAEQNAAELKLRSQQLMQQAKAQEEEAKWTGTNALLGVADRLERSGQGGDIQLPDGTVINVPNIMKQIEMKRQLAEAAARGGVEGTARPIPPEIATTVESQRQLNPRTTSEQPFDLSGSRTPNELQAFMQMIGRGAQNDVATADVPEFGLRAGQAYDPRSATAQGAVWQERQQNARSQQALDAKKPDPKEGDRIADAWAQGMSFPQTQEATNAALDSFERRGMQVPRRLSATMQQDVVRATDTIQTIDDVSYLYEKVKSKVGPWSYPLGEFAQRVPGIAADPDFAAFNMMLRGMNNLEIKRITGAQMSEGEAERLLKGMATGTLKREEFEAGLKIMLRNARRNRDITLYGKTKSMREEETSTSSSSKVDAMLDEILKGGK